MVVVVGGGGGGGRVVMVVVVVAVVVMVEKRPGGSRGLEARPERVEGPKSTVLSLSRTGDGILTLERRPREPRESVCKGTVVLVPRRVAPLFSSLFLSYSLSLYLSLSRAYSFLPPYCPSTYHTTFLHSPFPHCGALTITLQIALLPRPRL